MDYQCLKCRETHHGNTLKRRRCVRCGGRTRRLLGGVPRRQMLNLKELASSHCVCPDLA